MTPHLNSSYGKKDTLGIQSSLSDFRESTHNPHRLNVGSIIPESRNESFSISVDIKNSTTKEGSRKEIKVVKFEERSETVSNQEILQETDERLITDSPVMVKEVSVKGRNKIQEGSRVNDHLKPQSSIKSNEKRKSNSLKNQVEQETQTDHQTFIEFMFDFLEYLGKQLDFNLL